MCLAPVKIPTPDGGQIIACRKCWQCKDTKVSDWVGRNIAESKTAKATHVVTLTYGKYEGNPNHIRAKVLVYSDVQKFIKTLRSAGYPCRYFAVGEYGTTKGRAHWHIFLYWKDQVPPHVLRENYTFKHWPHGHTFWDKPSYEAVRYACKYLQKDLDDPERQAHLAMSKKPPLGTDWIKQYAESFVEAGVAPWSLEYSFPDVARFKDGAMRPRVFTLRGRSGEIFLEHFVRSWMAARPTQDIPRTPVIEEYIDPGAWRTNTVRKSPIFLPQAVLLDRPKKEELQNWMRWNSVFRDPETGVWFHNHTSREETRRWFLILRGEPVWLESLDGIELPRAA